VTARSFPETLSKPVDEEGLQLVVEEDHSPLLPPIPVALTPGVAAPATIRVPDSPLRDMVQRYRFTVPYRGVGTDLLMDRYVAAWPDVHASASYDLPELKKVPGLIRQGVKLPLVPGLDPSFVILHRVHPFLAPALHPAIRTSEVPMGIDAASFELTRRFLEDGQLPPSELLRTEEFLAAVDYEFPKPKQAPLALFAAGAASPFRGPRLHVLQFGVQARDVPEQARPAARLVIAVDVSASMRWGGRLKMVRQAVGRLIERIGPDDRISLVMFSEDAYLLADDVGRDAAHLLRGAIAELKPRTSTNVAAGLRCAYGAVRHGFGSDGKRADVVLMSDGLARLDPVTVDLVQDRLAEARARSVTLHVVDLAQDPAGDPPDPLLSGLAQAGGGGIHRAGNANQVHWALLEVITGQSQRVASDVRLRVRFNPKSVAAYRLVGHEALRFAGLRPAPLETDFYAGQSATAIYEVVLRNHAEKEVATAEVTWNDTQRSQGGSLVRTIGRGRLAKTLVDAPLWLQSAALVAEAGEALRGNPEVFLLPTGHSLVRPRVRPWSLARVLQVARQLDTRLNEKDSLTEFLSVVEQAGLAAPSRSGGRIEDRSLLESRE
jgi:Mg-chelatase subunit ChlD